VQVIAVLLPGGVTSAGARLASVNVLCSVPFLEMLNCMVPDLLSETWENPESEKTTNNKPNNALFIMLLFYVEYC